MAVASGGGRHDRPCPPFSDHQAHDYENVAFPTIRDAARRKCPSEVKYRNLDAFVCLEARPEKGSAVRVSTLGRAERRDHRRERPAPPQNSK